MSKMVLISYDRYKNIQGACVNNETSNIETINKYKDKILNMFHARDRSKVTSILTFMNDINELDLDESLNIILSGRKTRIHICDFINDMIYPSKRVISPEYMELYDFLKKKNIPQKLISNKARIDSTLIKDINENKYHEKWLKY